jgi:hypothetical protein
MFSFLFLFLDHSNANRCDRDVRIKLAANTHISFVHGNSQLQDTEQQQQQHTAQDVNFD